jgi:DNA-binding LytR/AlgR family response regulator
MIKVAVCDSEILFRKNINSCCHKYLQEKKIEHEILEYESGEELLMASFPDVLLMDVKLKGISGILVKEILWRKCADTRIIFISESKRLMPEAYGKNVFGFLIKPLKYMSFCERMDIILDDIRLKPQGIYCKTDGVIEHILYKDIVYVMAGGRYTKICLAGEKTHKHCEIGIRRWEKVCSESGLLRCHQSYLVNPAFVIRVGSSLTQDAGELCLIDEIRIPISKKYIADIEKCYGYRGNERSKQL